jgi:hypothetical protein
MRLDTWRLSPARLAGGVCSTALAFALFCSTGCAHYSVPGRAADMSAFGAKQVEGSDPSIIASQSKRPLAHFPTAVAAVRVQAPGYRPDSGVTWGKGRYCIVTTRDVEKDSQTARLAKMPLVAGVVPINRLLLPEELNSDLELRQAAAALHADVLLVYTLDTTFEVEDKVAPLTTLTLGLSPTENASAVCTASAVLLDTHNGFVYGVAEATDKSSQIASAWTSGAAVDDTRKRTEAGAFEKLVGELEKSWDGVIRTYAAPEGAVDR